MGFVLKTNCKKKPLIVFHFWEFQKQQQEGIADSPQYWAKAAASKVVEQQASPKISNFPFWFSQNQKTNSILRKGFEIENSVAVMSPLNGHNKGLISDLSDFNIFGFLNVAHDNKKWEITSPQHGEYRKDSVTRRYQMGQ